MTTEKRIGTILLSLVMSMAIVFMVFIIGSDLIAAFKMEDRVQSSYGMFMIVFLSPFLLSFFLVVIYLGVTLTPEKLKELEKNRKKKKKKKSPALHERIMLFFLAIAVIGAVVSIPLSWYMHSRLLDAGYVICESKFGKGSTRYAKEKRLCH